ncbi:hypothetical protein DPMN_161675 [Dreissena polymorpha]|uniref:Uncharacterized protein n=1 Tax=Dreissena polymorpha TaxID=45954 RepID=A0A9D4ENX0_DREPO|nr:hypothetical protein DPMN_161675 [Dreissena polymorpha]
MLDCQALRRLPISREAMRPKAGPLDPSGPGLPQHPLAGAGQPGGHEADGLATVQYQQCHSEQVVQWQSESN